MHIFTCRSTHPPFLFYIWWMLFSCLSSALRPNSIGDSSGLHLSSCRNWCRVHWVTNPHVIQILICYSIFPSSSISSSSKLHTECKVLRGISMSYHCDFSLSNSPSTSRSNTPSSWIRDLGTGL
ncbi:hypothetical protein BDR07DRAFT_345926 [Suillus spraguei]|nr:hypothetical protein BDR07DRAFT_345926 [Suillus spraguei]